MEKAVSSELIGGAVDVAQGDVMGVFELGGAGAIAGIDAKTKKKYGGQEQIQSGVLTALDKGEKYLKEKAAQKQAMGLKKKVMTQYS